MKASPEMKTALRSAVLVVILTMSLSPFARGEPCFPPTSTLSGAIETHVHAHKSGPGTKTARLKATYFIRDFCGNETWIGDCVTTLSLKSVPTTPTLSSLTEASTTPTLLFFQTLPIDPVAVHWTDRLVVKLSYILTGPGDNPSVSLQYEGQTGSCVNIPMIPHQPRRFRTFFLTSEAADVGMCVDGHALTVPEYRRMTDHMPSSEYGYSEIRATLPPRWPPCDSEHEIGRWISPPLGPWRRFRKVSNPEIEP
jgi:hypothetical protein